MHSTFRSAVGALIFGASALAYAIVGQADDPFAENSPANAKPQADAKTQAVAKTQVSQKPHAEKRPHDEKLPPKAPAAKGPAAKLDLPPGRVIFQQSDVERSVREALDQSTELEFIDTQLGDIATHLSLLHKIPIRIDLPALEADGKAPDTTFTCAIRGATLRSALRSMLKTEDLTFAVADDHLVITTESGASSYVQTRIYQVHDLVVAANDPTAEAPQFYKLIDLIEMSILPDTWMNAGGLEGRINAYEAPGVMALVVTHTEIGHELVEQLLTNLRLANDPKVAEIQRHRQTPPTGDDDMQQPVVISHPVVGGMGGNVEQPAPAPAAVQGGRFF